MKNVQFTKEQLIQSGKANLFTPDSPRLPTDNMLMFDRITKMNNDGGTNGVGEITAELDINPDLWFFKCHFISDPVMPGCLGLDAMWQLIGFFLAWDGALGKGRALGVGEVKFKGQVLPTAKKVTYQIDFNRIMRGNLIMGIANGQMLVDDKVIYTAKNLKVGVFKDTSDF